MSIGIMLFETAGSRLKGDPGYPGTFDFPVEYGVVKGSYRDLIDGSEAAKQRLIETARELERRGVAAIAGDCGLMALYQRELAAAVNLPVLSSSLVLIPFIRAVISENRAIGILTGHSELLGRHHLTGAGAAGETKNLRIQGMQDEPHFQKVVIRGEGEAQYNLMKQDVFSGVRKLMQGQGLAVDGLADNAKSEEAPANRSVTELGAVLLECSNLAVFGAEVAAEFGVPVFDINTGINLLQSGWVKQNDS